MKLDYRDFVTTEEKAFEILSDKKTWEIIEDPRYEPILIALRKGPMSVKELEREYNLIIAKKIEKMPLEDEEKKEIREKAERKGKTLYKYLDILIKLGLVVHAGKRVKMGQTASETLYGRIAKVYFKSDKDFTKLRVNEIKKSIPIIAKIISMEKKAKEISEECLTKFIKECYIMLHNERKRVLSKYSEEITKTAVDAKYDELNLVNQFLDIYYLITHASELKKLLNDCIKS